LIAKRNAMEGLRSLYMKKLESWSKVNEVMYGFAGSMAGKAFETV
jgi:hypothetical protein